MFCSGQVSAVYCLVLLPRNAAHSYTLTPPAKSKSAKNTRKRHELTALLPSLKGGNLEVPPPGSLLGLALGRALGRALLPAGLGLLPPRPPEHPEGSAGRPGRPGRCPPPPEARVGTYAVSSVAPWTAVAGSAQARAAQALSGEGAASGRASWKRRPVQGRAESRGGWRLGVGRRPPASCTRAGARGPLLCGNNNGSCHPAALAVRPFLRPAAGPESRRAGGSEKARPHLPSPRPAPRCPATWRRRCPAAPRHCGHGCRALRLLLPPGCPQPPGLPARAPAATPLPW